MWIVIDGLAGSGKTWLMSKLMYKGWKHGRKVWANFKLTFSKTNKDVHRFYLLEETYQLTEAILGFDELQDLAGHWQGMPISFRNKIAHHRHNFLDVFCTTQDFNDLHVELRRNVHERYRCESIFRFPRSDSVKPILQLIRVVHKTRQIKYDNDEVRFRKLGWAKLYFISRWFSRELYNTHANIDFNKYICKFQYEKKPGQRKGAWVYKMYSRDLVNQGKARL